MKGLTRWAVGIAAAVLLAAPPASWAKPPVGGGAHGAHGAQDFDSARRIDVNQLNMWVTNFGTIAWDVTTGNAGMVYPKGTDKTAIFASGLWMGATINSVPHTVVAEYSQEYNPGQMIGGTFDSPTNPDYIVYKVVRFQGSPEDTSHVERSSTSYAFADNLVHHSWSEYMHGAAPHGAPWKLYRLPDPNSPGDSVDVPGPDILGDMMTWCVFNDADPTIHTNQAGKSSPFGVEVQQTAFAFNRQGALGLTIFLKYKIINKGSNTLNKMYVSLWADPDLGGFTDDLVGCDTTLSLGFVYNSNNSDAIYGKAPPALGYDFFRGPIVNGGADTLKLASFNKYINGTDPSSTAQTYNYMQGLQPDGTQLTNPTNGQVTTFFVSGDPVLGSGWLDTNPGDRRFLLTTGPFTMAPGDTQEIVGGIVVGQGNDRLSSVSALRFNDTFAQAAFDSAFNLPSPPAQPRVQAQVDHGQVTLCWDENSRLNYRQPGYAFEGYNVYQGASIAGPWTRVATYDEVDNIRVIYDEVFDFTTGQIIPLFPVAFGSDQGVQFCHTQTQDGVLGGPLHDGTAYYFAVTAYSYNPIGKPKVLENAQEAITLIPQRPASGTDKSTATADCPVQGQVAAGPPKGTDVVTVEVVNPDSVTGHQYKVFYRTPIAPDTTSWGLLDVTKGDTLLQRRTNVTGDNNYPIVDGLRVKVIGPPVATPGLAAVDFLCHPQDWLEGNSAWQGPFFNGGGDYGSDFFGSTLDPLFGSTPLDSFTTIEIRFSHTQTQKAYRYLRWEVGANGGAPFDDPPARVWSYGGYVNVPFTVWDVDRNVQVEACYIERVFTDGNGSLLPPSQQPATFDSTWLPSDADNGGREILGLMKSVYTGTANPAFAVDDAICETKACAGPIMPIAYMLYSRRTSPFVSIPDGSVIRFTAQSVPGGPNDFYTIDTHGMVRGNTALAKNKLDQVRVVPNPYYNRSRYELNAFNRVIRFINLPETCTIRIFSLAGDLVRTLQKTDRSSSILDWNVQTDNQLPVASGVYIYHIDAPGVGTTFGRMVVFMEKERLNNF
ncbi:MAG TPA: hypothetical protein VKF80_02380 [Candidatus Eisenbacteria bacterium]|nr:hypothetical protein [Candidatus Eisenbacteria bacterium]